MGKRLFLAVDIDDATRRQVGAIASGLREAIETHTKGIPEPRGAASWVRPERMHLTLHFLGNVDDAFEQRVRHALTNPIRVAPFDVTFDGLGMFPERGSPRVLWLGVAEGLEPLRRLHGVVVARLKSSPTSERASPTSERASPTSEGAAPIPERTAESFTPHLTLARFRDRVNRSTLAGITGIPAFAGPSRIDRVTLYESRLSPAGPTYVRLAETPLTRSD